jgi:peptidoglycan/LPS O-acetylase OafA/YrhL
MGETLGAVNNRAHDARTCAVEIGAALVLILAATVMPWATYKNTATDATTTFRGGTLGVVLVVLGGLSIALSLMSLREPSRVRGRIHLAVGCAAMLVCVVLALHKISTANHVTVAGGAQTAYGFAPGVAFVAAATITVTSLRGLRAPDRAA